MSAHMSAVLSSWHKFTFVLFLLLTKDGTSFIFFYAAFYGCADYKSCIWNSGNGPPTHMQRFLSRGRDTENIIGVV